MLKLCKVDHPCKDRGLRADEGGGEGGEPDAKGSAAVVAEVERHFAGFGGPNAPEPVPARFTGGETRRVKDLEQAHIALAFESPGYRDDAIYTAQIYSSALGGGMSSRLFQEVRERRGLCYTIFAQTGAYADTGTTTIYAGTSGEQLGDLACITIDEMKRAADTMTEEEVARARAQMKAGMLMGLESPSNRSERLARLIQIWDRVPPLEDTIARIDAVTTADVRDMAGQIAHSAPAALALYGPVGDAPSLAALRLRHAA